MKTQFQIEKLLEAASAELRNPKANAKTAQRKYNEISQALLYLKTNPSELFIKNHLKALESKLDQINACFETWKYQHTKSSTMEKARSFYDKLNGVTELKKNIKFYNFILDE